MNDQILSLPNEKSFLDLLQEENKCVMDYNILLSRIHFHHDEVKKNSSFNDYEHKTLCDYYEDEIEIDMQEFSKADAELKAIRRKIKDYIMTY